MLSKLAYPFDGFFYTLLMDIGVYNFPLKKFIVNTYLSEKINFKFYN